MEKRRPTLRDVSAAANVSTFAASRALSGGIGVSPKTREAVLEIANALGYVPNQHARNLKGSRSSVVAVLTANMANQYYSVLVSSLESAIELEDFDCIAMDAMLDGEYSQKREDRFVASLRAQRVAAVVVTYNLSQPNMEALSNWGVPILFVDCQAPAGFERYPAVLSDSFEGSAALGRHLAGHGYKRWAFVGHTKTWGSRLPRQAGFEAAAREAGAVVDIVEGANSTSTAQDAVTHYLMSLPRRKWPQVVYASNTVLLHGVLRALRKLNIRIPSDIALVGFDEFDWAEMLDPPLTVVDQDIASIGRTAGALLLRQLKDDGDERGDEVILKPSLRIRASCGCGSSCGTPAAATA